MNTHHAYGLLAGIALVTLGHIPLTAADPDCTKRFNTCDIGPQLAGGSTGVDCSASNGLGYATTILWGNISGSVPDGKPAPIPVLTAADYPPGIPLADMANMLASANAQVSAILTKVYTKCGKKRGVGATTPMVDVSWVVPASGNTVTVKIPEPCSSGSTGAAIRCTP